MADAWVATIKTWAAAVLPSSALNEEIRDRAQVLANAVDGDSSASTIKHRHKTGTLAARPAAGEAGRFYYATDTKALSIDDGSAWFTPHVSILDRDLTRQEKVNDGGLLGIWSYSVAANELGTTGGVRLTLSGDYLNDTGVDRTLRFVITFGTTALFDGAFTLPWSASRRKWRLVLEGMNSAANAQKWSAFLAMGKASSVDFAVTSPTETDDGRATGIAASVEDTTGALTLKVEIQHNIPDASLSLRKEIAILEKLPAA